MYKDLKWKIPLILATILGAAWLALPLKEKIALGLDLHFMQGIGLVMIALFLHLYFAPYRRLKAAVLREDWADGAKRLGQIRQIVGINTVLGLLLVVIGSGGRYV